MTLDLDLAHSAPSRTWLRSAGAVLAGFVVVAALSTGADAALHAAGYYPTDGSVGSDANLALALAYRTAFTVLGGWLVARLAPNHPFGHSVVLGLIGMVLATLGAVAMWSVGHNWYPIGLVVLALPSTALGGWLFARARR